MSERLQDILPHLPELRGRLREKAELANVNWFRVGGPAEFLFKPEDTQDLAYFMANKPKDIAITTLGVGSNLLVRDGGIKGAVIRLGRGFAGCIADGDRLIAGAGCLNANLTLAAKDAGIGGLEFLSGIPGTVGGALAMNAGAYGAETRDVLVEAEAVDPTGLLHRLPCESMNYRYRHCGLPEGWIFTLAVFHGKAEAPAIIKERIAKIASARAETQPIRERTGGSTFRNPKGHKAWQLIDAAACRGLTIGGAQMSSLHCNFMINTGSATAQDLENLGEEVRRRVMERSGIQLEWEIKRIGNALPHANERAVA